MMHVRPYRETDAQACAAVILSAVEGMMELNAAARELILTHSDVAHLTVELPRYHTVVLTLGDVVCALGALDDAEIKRIFVHRSAQGRGAGRAITSALEAEARRNGIEEVFLHAGATAVPFYRRLGYEAGDADVYVDGEARVPFTTMRKRL
jgi:GNAT superfamily N-acetyltransferase